MKNEEDVSLSESGKVDCGRIPTSSWPFGEQYKGCGGGTIDPLSPAARAGTSVIIRKRNGSRKSGVGKGRSSGQGRRFAE